MSYTATATVDQTVVREWIAARLEPHTVEEQLRSRGLDAEQIRQYLQEFRRLKYARQQFIGFICMGVGAFLGFLSCVLSIANPWPDLYNLILFGLTSVAILIICLGLYFVFE